jgi:hypothetical protein
VPLYTFFAIYQNIRNIQRSQTTSESSGADETEEEDEPALREETASGSRFLRSSSDMPSSHLLQGQEVA